MTPVPEDADRPSDPTDIREPNVRANAGAPDVHDRGPDDAGSGDRAESETSTRSDDPIDGQSTVGWRFAVTTVQGPSHVKTDTVCQDAAEARLVSLPSGHDYVVLAVADGAGTASRSDRGATLACSLVVKELADRITSAGSLAELDLDGARDIVGWCADRIAAIAEAESVAPREFASTLLAVAVGPDECACLQVGDGVIVVRGAESDETEYKEVFWPDRGEYANETMFVTDPRTVDRVRFERWSGEIVEVALTTDGLQPLVLSYAERSVHSRFFAKTFQTLGGTEPGFQSEISLRLADALASPAIAERGDDDKALALAVRVNKTRL